ncbi:hypothetical protein VT84_09305 [Gemmata sp. SH-PL17]|uniref:hypothetical protein n=1 Tax=Gemmata sp. SH-PL17 TaxID=1630693 RepID=UPI00078D26AE|nr:hypothetical protein [Gemmata sp. SH-PL17]AMV24580.1 hypothetical protein VT84_09305 [Gemmata sp. SH-PL17]
MPAPAPDAATATPTMPATCAAALPATCAIRGLVAFGPGYHKNELYSPQRCDQIAANYAATGGRPIPLAKIGHDKQQRYAQSLGFPNVGMVTKCVPVGGGCFAVDIDNVPTEIGAKVNAGLLRGSSVELKSHQRDPKDPARELPGDVLTGISLLGEEQPAVQNWPEHLRAKAVPRATFADGSEVPPNHDVARWLNLAAEVSDDIAAEQGGEFSADRRTVRIRGRSYAANTLCFSDFDSNPDPGPTMTPEQEAALQAAGFTPEQIAAMKAALPAGGGAAAVPSPPATNPTMSDANAMPPWAKEMSDCVKKMSSEVDEVKKRQGEFAAFADAQQKQTTEAQMAAFSDQVNRACLALSKKVEPKLMESVVKPTAMNILTAKTFSAETDRVKAFNDYFAGFAAMPDDPRLAITAGPAVKQTPAALANSNPVIAAMTAKGTVLDRLSPELAKAYREPAAA